MLISCKSMQDDFSDYKGCKCSNVTFCRGFSNSPLLKECAFSFVHLRFLAGPLVVAIATFKIPKWER